MNNNNETQSKKSRNDSCFYFGDNSGHSRRKFIKEAAIATGILSLGFSSSCESKRDKEEIPAKSKTETTLNNGRKLFEKRMLGKTGLMVSSLGAGQSMQPERYIEAMEAGINIFETARGYAGGNHEHIIGKALKKLKREDVVIVTKFPSQHATYESCIQTLEKSLKALGIDTIDVFLIHGAYDDSTISNDVILKALNG
jgi:hypothetical protein